VGEQTLSFNSYYLQSISVCAGKVMADEKVPPYSKSMSLGSIPDRLEGTHMGGGGATNGAMEVEEEEEFTTVTLVAKYAKEQITLDGLPVWTTISQVKEMLREQTNILPKRQKLVGLVAQTGGAKGVHDQLPVGQLKAKKGKPTAAAAAASDDGDADTSRIIMHQFILMGTPEEST